jgi:hypothetical protein
MCAEYVEMYCIERFVEGVSNRTLRGKMVNLIWFDIKEKINHPPEIKEICLYQIHTVQDTEEFQVPA